MLCNLCDYRAEDWKAKKAGEETTLTEAYGVHSLFRHKRGAKIENWPPQDRLKVWVRDYDRMPENCECVEE